MDAGVFVDGCEIAFVDGCASGGVFMAVCVIVNVFICRCMC